MADLKISQLTGATTPLAGTEVLPIVQSSSTKKVSVSDLTAGRTVLAEQLSVGGTASSWSGFKAVDISNSGAVAAYPGFSMSIFRNAYYDGSNYKYKINGAASHLELDANGKFNYQTAVSGSANGNITFTSRFEIEENTGNVLAKTGNVAFSTAAKGVDFSANTGAAGKTSSLLNWYEEGTWTPQYTNTTPPTTPYTMTIYSATYTRIGRQVTVRAFIATSDVNITGASGELSISGLPFAPASSNAAYSAANVASLANWTTYPAFGYVASDSKIYLEKRAASNGASANMTAADLVAGATAGQNLMMITATYFTA